jgi:hypothetical protein
MKKEKGMKDFTIDDLEYGADKVKQVPDDITSDYYNKNVMAYLTRNDSKKSYYDPRRGRSKSKQVSNVPPVSNTVAEMLIDLQKRIDAQNIQTLPPMQPMQDDFQRQLQSGIGTVIINALNKRSR